MGRPFLEHLGGRQIFACERCDTYLSNSKEVLSRTFRGATGTAYLFRNVVNIQLVGKESRQMITGNHVVRDVHCKNCRNKLGWMYEFAHDPTQAYKEGRVILERLLLRESEEANVRLAERVQQGMRRSDSASSMSSSGVSSVTVT